MKLLKQTVLLIFNKVLRRKSTGYCLKVFCSNMGMAYIKLCQMLALQNIGNLFKEQDRLDVLSICYDVNPIPYSEIRKELIKEYGKDYRKHFHSISKTPIGSASVSQVHRAKLCTGEDVVLKVKRQDIMRSVTKDIETLRFLCNHFGWLFGITNHATETAWKYYFKWLQEETDFRHEVENIHILQRFASSVNGKVPNTQRLLVPKVYDEYCTDNVIVMEYVPYKTINKIEDTALVTKALNSYIRQSFYALFNDIPVVYHGDMHPGNLYIDEHGNLGFLDMGLVFVISKEDANLTRKLFMNEWLMNVDSLSRLLAPWFKGTSAEYYTFTEKLTEVVHKLPSKCVSSYFMDVVFLCLDVDLTPPYFLFCMAKAFVCLFGADSIYMNSLTCRNMLEDIVLEYMMSDLCSDSKELAKDIYAVAMSAVHRNKSQLWMSLARCSHKLNKYVKYIDSMHL